MKTIPKNLSKLTPDQVEEIKAHLLDERGVRQEWIAKKYGVTQSSISYYNRRLKSAGQKTGR